MNRKLRSLALLLFACSNLTSSAAEEPTTHEVLFPKGDAAWTVRIEKVSAERKPEGEKSNSGEPRNVQSIDVVRLGKLRRDSIKWSDGSSTEYWWISQPPIALLRGKPGEEIRVMKIGQLGPRRFDESTFAWVSATTFESIETFRGRKVRRYKLETPVEDNEKTTTYAIIDNETAKPIAWSDGQKHAIFSFSTTLPEGPLLLPADFQETLRKHEAYYAPAQRKGKR